MNNRMAEIRECYEDSFQHFSYHLMKAGAPLAETVEVHDRKRDMKYLLDRLEAAEKALNRIVNDSPQYTSCEQCNDLVDLASAALKEAL